MRSTSSVGIGVAFRGPCRMRQETQSFFTEGVTTRPERLKRAVGSASLAERRQETQKSLEP